MEFSLVKNGSSFAWEQLKKHTDSWFMLSLKSFGMTFVMIGGLCVYMLCALFLYGFMAITPHSFVYDPAWYVQVLTLIFFLVGIYQALIHIVSYSNVPVANALDVAYGKPMRKFSNRVQIRALLFVPLLQAIIIGLGLICFVVPGIYFAVRFSLARNIAIDEHCRSTHALAVSWRMTQGNFWSLLPVGILSATLLLFPITRILNMFFPFVDLLMSHTYVFLKQK